MVADPQHRPLCIAANDVSIRRGTFAVHIPSWQVEPGQVVGLVGHNGAGKTTLLDALAGLLPTTGQLTVLGLQPERDGAALRLRLAYAAPHLALWDLPLARLASQLGRFWPTWDGGCCRDLLSRFGLDDCARPSELSAGQMALLRVALALSFGPELLLLDEPSAGLDAAMRRLLLHEIRAVAQDERRTVVLSTHLLDDVERVADSLLVLDRGRVVQAGPTDTVLTGDRTLAETLLALGPR